MTVKELFMTVNVDSPRVIIFGKNGNIVWQKEPRYPVAKNKFLNHRIAWIYRIDSSEICLRIEEEQYDLTP